MELIDTIGVRHQGTDRSIMLFVGDLASLPERESVDALVVSAFPDDYAPTDRSLIGALARAGVLVSDLARDKQVDLRAFSCCWLSRPIDCPGVHFGRVLCFEPAHRGRAPEVVGDIFRSIVPFTTGKPPISQIAMPLVASGDQSEPPEVMLGALLDAAAHWLSIGLPLDRIKIVLHESADSPSLRGAFAQAKRRYAEAAPAPEQPAYRFDVFVSYSHKNKGAVDDLVREMLARRASLRIFLDRLELRPGAAWQQHIFDALDASRKVISVFSPDYLASRICKEEFNIALLRHREAAHGVLLPLYLHTSNLPGYMRLIQYEDAREGDSAKIAESAERLLAHI